MNCFQRGQKGIWLGVVGGSSFLKKCINHLLVYEKNIPGGVPVYLNGRLVSRNIVATCVCSGSKGLLGLDLKEYPSLQALKYGYFAGN